MIQKLSLLSVLVASGHAVAGDSFLIKSKLLQGGNVLGTPAVAVASGKTGKVSATGAYDLSFEAEPRGEDAVYLSTRIDIAGETSSPSMLLNLDEESSISIGDTTMRIIVSRFEAN